jgi:hypothetical protein
MPVDVMADDFLCGEVRRLASVGKGDPHWELGVLFSITASSS